MGTRRGSLGMKIHMVLGVNHRIYGSIPKGIRVELTNLSTSWSGVLDQGEVIYRPKGRVSLCQFDF